MTRYVPGHFVVGQPDMDEATECHDCGFDAVLTFPISIISEAGVTSFGTYKACARCYDTADES